MEIDRRSMLAGLALIGVLPLSAIISACSRESVSDPTPTRPAGPRRVPGWIEPVELTSVGGTLVAQQVAAAASWTIDGVDYDAKSLTGTIPSTTWRVRPGDRVEVHLRNDLDEQNTNLHPHGFHVSPNGNSDNVYVDIAPDTEFVYSFQLPADHPPGTYWYHPHRHHLATEQISSGMAGAVIIEGLEEKVPALEGIPQAIVVLQGLWLQPSTQTIYTKFLQEATPDDLTQVLLCNGLVNPAMNLASGSSAWLRIINASASALARIQFDDHPLHVLAVDGNPLAKTVVVDSWDLPPGGRIDAVIVAGDPGTYTFGSIDASDLFPEDTPPPYEQRVDEVILNVNTAFTLSVSASKAAAAIVPTTLTSDYFEDLRELTPARTRTITAGFVTADDGSISMQMDGREFDVDRVDQQPQLGTMEEWRFVNTSDDSGQETLHPMHIHVNPVQLVSSNGVATGEMFYRDTVILPNGGEMVIRTRFLDFEGEFVAHCHNLMHEDQGMMQNVKVVLKSSDPTTVNAESPDLKESPPSITTSTSQGHGH